jgi:replicative DNA helicase
MNNKYIDISSIIQVIGCIFKTPQLLDYTDKYTIVDDDFTDDFHKIIFGSIYKLHELGAEKITLNSIIDYLHSRPKSEAIFIKQKGEEWIIKAVENAEPASFDYYYNRMKKMTLLRAFYNGGIDVSFIYDPDNIIDLKKRQQQEDYLDNISLQALADIVQDKIDSIKAEYVDGSWGEAYEAGDGLEELVIELEKSPEVGVPLYGPLINTVTRGARLKKFYLRSAPTGVGKTRGMIADACYIGCNKIYDDAFGWISAGVSQPVLYITTEQELSEIQTMMLAFISNVNEEHILNGKYEGDERDRINQAIKILKESPIYIEVLPDFSLQDVENKIKKNIRDHDVLYVFYDYIHTSLKILEEITRRSGGVKLREDTILFMLSIRLKDICNKYGVFIMSAT